MIKRFYPRPGKALPLMATILLIVWSPVSAQHQLIKNHVQDFFFDIPFDTDIEVIKLQLGQDPEFKLYEDPNRSSDKTIVGTVLKDKSLNPVAFGNQLIIVYLSKSKKKKKNISIKWSMDYKLEDLASAMVDYDKMISEFKPLFTEITERQKTGQHQEQISSWTMKMDMVTLVFTLIKYNNFIHTLSVEYHDRWKIEPVDILKVKY